MNEPNSSMGDAKTYRGGSLEELLPLIREELGPDAMITRQRDGIVGGFGGFFGKKTVEVEARPSGPLFQAPPPESGYARPEPRRFDLYDTSETEAEEARPAPSGNRLLDELYRQASPFAERLSEAELELPPDEPEAAAEPEARFTAVPAPAPAPALEAEPEPAYEPTPDPRFEAGPRLAAEPRTAATPRRSATPRRAHDRELAPAVPELAALREALALSGVPSSIADAVLSEAETQLQPFDRIEPLAAHVRRALAGRITVRHGWRTPRRTIALVGPQGAGRTLTAAKLCHAYSDGTAMSVVALSTERASRALRLGTFAEQIGVDFEIADNPAAIAQVRRNVRHHQLVVADLPAVEAGDAQSLGRACELLDALHPHETHLVVPAALGADSVRLLLLDLQARTKVHRLLITHADDQLGAGAGAVGASLSAHLPISYVTDSGLPASGIHPAQPDELARLTLR